MAGNYPSITDASGDASENSYTDTYGVDGRYTVILTASGEGGESISFQTSIDETTALGLSSQWAAPFENLMGEAMDRVAQKGGKAGKIAGGLAGALKLTGTQIRPKMLTAQVWQSSDAIKLTIPFTFAAVTNAYVDVHKKVKDLLKLCAPSEVMSGVISAPGPVMLDQATGGGRNIELRIGKYLSLTPCIIRAVQVQFENVIGEAGIPLRAKVDVEIESWYTLFTTKDIDKLFLDE